jgi:hypothetical protein
MPDYQFTTTVQSVGRTKANNGTKLELEWKLPGSQYELVLYLQDNTWLKHLEELGLRSGDWVDLDIDKGSLKANADGSHEWDYYWDVTAIKRAEDETPTTTAPPKPSAPAPQSPERRQDASYSPDPTRQSIERQVALKEARRAATDMWNLLPWEGEPQRSAATYVNLVETVYVHFVRFLNNGPTNGPHNPPSPPKSADTGPLKNKGTINNSLINKRVAETKPEPTDEKFWSYVEELGYTADDVRAILGCDLPIVGSEPQIQAGVLEWWIEMGGTKRSAAKTIKAYKESHPDGTVHAAVEEPEQVAASDLPF